MTLDTVYTALCAGVFWSCFCRLVRTNGTTHSVVRLGFWVLGAAALAGALSPWIWAVRASWPAVGMAAGMLILQAFTASQWRDGVPAQFQRGASHGV